MVINGVKFSTCDYGHTNDKNSRDISLSSNSNTLVILSFILLLSTVYLPLWTSSVAPSVASFQFGIRASPGWPPELRWDCRRKRNRSIWRDSSVYRWILWPKWFFQMEGKLWPGQCPWTLAAGGRWTNCSPQDLQGWRLRRIKVVFLIVVETLLTFCLFSCYDHVSWRRGWCQR